MKAQRVFLTVAGAIAMLFSSMMLVATSQFLQPLGLAATPDVEARAALLAQAQGVLLFGIGLLQVMARGVAEPAAVRALLTSNLAIQLLSIGVNGRGLAAGLLPGSAYGQLGMHLVFALAYAGFLVVAGRERVGDAAPSTTLHARR